MIKEASEESNKDWKKEFIKLEKGFIPPSNLRPIVQAFADSNNISIMNDTSKEINMPKKNLYLSGGSVRDFLKNKTPKNYNLSTNATPEQIGIILDNAGFKENGEDKKSWRHQDGSIIANVGGDEFEIVTFKKPGQKESEFTDNIEDDAQRRDLTINSMYIELSKADGENNKLYDPTKKGWYDAVHGNINTNNDAEKSFREDKLRMMRTVRFHSQYGKGPIDKKIQKAIEELKSDLKDVPFEKIREEFLKGLLNIDIDPRKYLESYDKLGLLSKVFPDVELNLNVPPDFSNKKDKILALAWILQDNPIEEVKRVLCSSAKIADSEQKTGWTAQERNAVVLLLKLKEFNLDDIDDLLETRKISGLSQEQIRNWVELFNVEGRSTRPMWAKQVKLFAKFNPDSKELLNWDSDEIEETSPIMRRQILKNMNKDKIKEMFKKNT